MTLRPVPNRKCSGCTTLGEEILVHIMPSSPIGLHRVLDPDRAHLPQAAQRLDARPELWPDEVRV
ncbi:MAG: hypothetical protein ACRCY9_23545, partial [Phycicoccus sp.]